MATQNEAASLVVQAIQKVVDEHQDFFMQGKGHPVIRRSIERAVAAGSQMVDAAGNRNETQIEVFHSSMEEALSRLPAFAKNPSAQELAKKLQDIQSFANSREGLARARSESHVVASGRRPRAQADTSPVPQTPEELALEAGRVIKNLTVDQPTTAAFVNANGELRLDLWNANAAIPTMVDPSGLPDPNGVSKFHEAIHKALQYVSGPSVALLASAKTIKNDLQALHQETLNIPAMGEGTSTEMPQVAVNPNDDRPHNRANPHGPHHNRRGGLAHVQHRGDWGAPSSDQGTQASQPVPGHQLPQVPHIQRRRGLAAKS